MEASFTPEFMIKTTAETMKTSAEGVWYLTKPFAHALLKVVSFGLDGLVRHYEGLQRLEPYTKAFRNTMWKDEYKKRGFM